MTFIDTKKIPAFSKSVDTVKQTVLGASKKLIPDTVSTGQTVPNSTQATPSTTSTVTPKAFSGDYASKQNELFGSLESTMKTPFQYNPETDPAYQAQRQLAQLRAKDANRATMETMNDRGLLQSTMTNSQLDQNAQRAEQEALAYIPQYRDQAYGQYQDKIRNAGELLTTARALRGDQFNEAVTEAGLTGTYKSPETQGIIKRITDLGEAWKTGTPEQKAAYHKEAEQLRSQLKGLGVDPSLFGANVSTEGRLANAGKVGVQTLAGKAQDFSQGVTTASLTGVLPDGTKTTAEQQRQLENEWAVAGQTGKITPALAKLYGIPVGTPTQAAKEFAQQLAISQQNANTSAYSAETSRKSYDLNKEEFEWSKDPKNPANQTSGATAEKYASYIDGSPTAFTKDAEGNPVQNNQVIESMILSSGLSPSEMTKLYQRYGIPMN